MESKVQYTIAGLFIIFFILAGILIVFWLAFGSTKRTVYNTYLTYISESVSGLNVNALVKYNGVNVGYVSQISLNPFNLQQVKLNLKIRQNILITQDTYATLASQGLTGISYVELRGGKVGSPPLLPLSGTEYPVIRAEPSLFFRLDTAVRELTFSFNQTTHHINNILNPANEKAFANTLAHLESVTNFAANHTQEVDKILKDWAETLHNMTKVSADLPVSLAKIDRASASIEQVMQDLQVTIRMANAQALPKMLTTMNNLEDVSRELKEFVAQLKRNPSSLLRGKKAQLGPGE